LAIVVWFAATTFVTLVFLRDPGPSDFFACVAAQGVVIAEA
jgi:hypothetical protein